MLPSRIRCIGYEMCSTTSRITELKRGTGCSSSSAEVIIPIVIGFQRPIDGRNIGVTHGQKARADRGYFVVIGECPRAGGHRSCVAAIRRSLEIYWNY